MITNENDEKYMKAIADCNKRLNAVERKLDAFFNMLHERNASDIAYIAMMEDIDMDDDEEEEGDTDE